jgi:PAS domain S-box-containing protein
MGEFQSPFFDGYALFIIDPVTFKIKDANDFAVSTYGYSREALQGMGIHDLEGENRYPDAAQEHHLEASLEERIWKHKTAAGEELYVQFTSHTFNYQGKPARLMVVHEVSEQVIDGEADGQKFPRVSSDRGERLPDESKYAYYRARLKELEGLFNATAVAAYVLDEEKKFIEVNDAAVALNGYSRDFLVGRTPDILSAPGKMDLRKNQDYFKKALAGTPQYLEQWGRRKNGNIFPAQVFLNPATYYGERVVVAISRDISEWYEAREKLKRSLEEKEVLLAEIHHRVKNNLAVITGLLELQQEGVEVEEAKEILIESQLRIHSIALVHETLYKSDNLSRISIDGYLKKLANVVAASVHHEPTEITVTVESDPVFLTINRAIPYALILNELLTNSYKHAFGDSDEAGTISIELRKRGYEIRLIFEDDGAGFPEDLDIEDPDSLGLTLIRTLSKQLRGTDAFENRAHGMRFTLVLGEDE